MAALAEGAIDPMMGILAAPFVIGLAVVSRAAIAGTVILGLWSLAYFVFMAPVVFHTPLADGLMFVAVWVAVIASLAACIAAVANFRELRAVAVVE
jgi:acyl dehydratase